MTPPIRILIADDHFVARVGVRAIINRQRDMKVVAEASGGRQAIELFRKGLPDLALLDLRMPGVDGTQAARAIRAEHPSAKMIALTSYVGDQDIRQALAAGMQGYVTKNGTIDELVVAIRAVHEGQTYLPSALAAALAAQPATADLSPRELEVLRLVARGLSNKQIAYALSIAEHTAKNHVKNVLDKLCVHDRTEAAVAAIQRGIIHSSTTS